MDVSCLDDKVDMVGAVWILLPPEQDLGAH